MLALVGENQEVVGLLLDDLDELGAARHVFEHPEALDFILTIKRGGLLLLNF